ncbi:hypothetical protein BC939DRAFT_526277 [Gamsiella multidivaricata]|uniref:uncharacterized protein n=1 Tax=Gamsiella multidivaricata TaxID=101098 RepID=UPI002220102E|nr:uncharacterized protein BC939DRAFT_526277 [Gamsiella multidivaricata]KAG0371076.1 hypothetical protein BGZ54_000524 [Gamsiella multidivaricata]KAI7829426.1 hypothetical protein BC939DRAFT_526277 [Gamsiella multidivaricata]
MSSKTSSLIKPELPRRPSPRPLHVEYSQPPVLLRPMECTTEQRFLEALFLVADDARDNHIRQLLKSLTHLESTSNVVRFMNLKSDLYDPKLCPPFSKQANGERSQPPWKQLRGQHYRVVTRITAIGRTSMKLQHRVLTVPKSQVNRDFNNRDEDTKYRELTPGDEPERQFASAEGVLVFILWQQDEQGHRFFKPHPCPFQDKALLSLPFVQMLCEQGPEPKTVDSQRPENAFRFELYLRKSDEDELGHVTNSRYVALLYEVLVYGLNKGYYANGYGPCRTLSPLPTYAKQDSQAGGPSDAHLASQIAVPANSKFYNTANIQELYVGYENELKVKPGVFVWSWVERERIQGQLDVIRFEICSHSGASSGKEKPVSMCRAIIREYQRPSQKASL